MVWLGDNAFLVAGILYIYYVRNQSKKFVLHWIAQPIFSNRSHPFPIISPPTTSAYNKPLTSATCWGKLRRTQSRMHWNFAFSLQKLTE